MNGATFGKRSNRAPAADADRVMAHLGGYDDPALLTLRVPCEPNDRSKMRSPQRPNSCRLCHPNYGWNRRDSWGRSVGLPIEENSCR